MSAPSFSHRVIAVDGPAASGKSSVSRKVAAALDHAFVSSGLMYRTFTWAVCDAGIDPENEPAVLDLLKTCTFESARRGNELFIRVNGQDPGDALTADHINANVSKIAKIPDVRKVMVSEQRACAQHNDIVMEGRDIGSVVFPETPYKFYLDASEEVRAQRRRAQGLEDAIAERDRADSTRKVSPLKVAEGANVIDTSELTLEQVVEVLLEKIREIEAGLAA